MKRSDPAGIRHNCRAGSLPLRIVLTPLLLLTLAGGWWVTSAQTSSSTTVGKQGPGGRIRFSADRLDWDFAGNVVRLTGNVRVAQVDLTITADEIEIIFAGDVTDGTIAAMDEAAFQKMTARGRVGLTFENKSARADQATYDTKRRILVLSGENTTVMMGENSITGTRITLYRIDGRIEVEGEGETRVEGVFFGEE